MSKLLVTGASGLLGANVVLEAWAKGWHVVPVSHQHTLKNGVTVDFNDAKATRNLIDDVHPECIVHCAAAANIDWCEDNPIAAEYINTRVPEIIAESAKKIGARLVHISTDAVFYGEQANMRYRETDPTNPPSVYAHTKLLAEQAVMACLPQSLVLRVNFYGWNFQPKHSLAEWILSKLSAQTPVPGFADVTFCPMLANDLCDVIFDLINNKATGLFHVVGGESISKYDFARLVAHTFAYDEQLVYPTSFKSAQLRALRSPNIALDVSKVECALERTMPNVADGLRRFKDLRENGFLTQLKEL